MRLLPPRPSAFLFALALAGFAHAQVDTAALQRRRGEAEQAVQKALAACEGGLQALRSALGDPNNKLQGNCDDIGNVLKGQSFDPALGVIPIALGFVDDYVPEERRAATKQALSALQQQLAAGSRALQQFEALQELVARSEQLAAVGADDDATGLLADFSASAGRAGRSAALPREELAQLRQFLQNATTKALQKRGRERIAQAKLELQALREQLPELRQGLKQADAAERDRAFARADDAIRSIATLLAEAPVADGAPLQQELRPIASEVDAASVVAYGDATRKRLEETWNFTADSFAGWEAETGEVTAQGYVDFDPPSADKLGQPQTVQLVDRANQFLAFAGTDADAVRHAQHPLVAKFVQSIRDRRAEAQAKLLRNARAIVDGMPALDLADERAHSRVLAFADWELPLALQNHAEQAALVDRVHALLDQHTRKTLGDRALPAIREQAATAADALWSRYLQWVPVQGGFAANQAPLFVGRTMRLENVWLRTEEFAVAAGELVFDLDGHVFVATMAPAVAAALAAQRTRLQLAPVERPSSDAPCDLVVVVGEPTEVRLLGPKGAEDAIVVPARRMQVLGLRQGPVFTMAP